MKRDIFLCVAFAALMVLIPIGNLKNAAPMPAQTMPAQTAPPESRPVAQTQAGTAAPQAAPVSLPPEVRPDEIRVFDVTTGETTVMTVREYALGALCAEMPPTFEPEALKAQAVAAYSYVLRLQSDSANSDAEFDITVESGSWHGFVTEELFKERYASKAEEYWSVMSSAVDAVGGYLLVYDDKPIVAAYHAINVGITEDASNVWGGSAPYLVPVASGGDELAPKFKTTELVAEDDVRERLLAAGISELPDDPGAIFSNARYSPSGYVIEIMAGGKAFTGRTIREMFGLRSAAFEVDFINKQFRFSVTGYGHGVGLSQYGAQYMAQGGATFDEILLHYYSGARLVKI